VQPYAQTNIELFNQLRSAGYSKADLSIVRDAYELAMELFAGRFQPSGKIFLAHVVRTASIAASFRSTAEVVAAGLLHNVYVTGDFGNHCHGASAVKRNEIKKALGPQAEEYIVRFPAMNLDVKPRTIRLARDKPEELELIERHVLLLMLAEHLEHLLDFDILYYPDEERRYYINNVGSAIEIAQNLGHKRLAAELNDALRQTQSAELPVELHLQRLDKSSRIIAPRSYCKRFGTAFHQAWWNGRRKLTGALNRFRASLVFITICSS
jgi:(p)ppGpp synthase/HD superfamily hydrolase